MPILDNLYLSNAGQGFCSGDDRKIILSVVVIAWNARATIEACIDGFKCCPRDVEVIVVDDLSADGTYEYLAKVDGIKLLRSEYTQGPLGARLLGLAYSCGQYVSFVDSDDTVSKGYLNVVLDTIRECPSIDFFFFPHVSSSDGKPKSPVRRYSSSRTLIENLLLDEISTVNWDKIYLNPIARGQEVPQLLSEYSPMRNEDLILNLYLLAGCSCFRVITEPLYFYASPAPSKYSGEAIISFMRDHLSVSLLAKNLLESMSTFICPSVWDARAFRFTAKYAFVSLLVRHNLLDVVRYLPYVYPRGCPWKYSPSPSKLILNPHLKLSEKLLCIVLPIIALARQLVIK